MTSDNIVDNEELSLPQLPEKIQKWKPGGASKAKSSSNIIRN